MTRSRSPGGRAGRLGGPKGDMVILDLEAAGNYVAVRPSGTEPKVKFYMLLTTRLRYPADLPAIKAAQTARMKALGADLRSFSGT